MSVYQLPMEEFHIDYNDSPFGNQIKPESRKIQSNVVKIYFLLACLSIAICIARNDYNVILYFLGLFMWLSEAETPLNFYISIKSLSTALIISIVVDVIWILFAMRSWFCIGISNQQICYQGESIIMQHTKVVHIIAMALSILALIIKAALVSFHYKFLDLERSSPYNVIAMSDDMRQEEMKQ